MPQIKIKGDKHEINHDYSGVNSARNTTILNHKSLGVNSS